MGLEQEARLGVNPFKLGFVASTDTHLGDARRRRPRAITPATAARARPRRGSCRTGLPDDVEFNPGGLAVLWAEENSRDALFAAMRRREVYGTSGPRHVVRFFGGWDLPDDLCEQRDVRGDGLRARRADGRRSAAAHGGRAALRRVRAARSRDPERIRARRSSASRS